MAANYAFGYNCLTDAEQLAQECLDSLHSLSHASTLKEEHGLNDGKVMSNHKHEFGTSFQEFTSSGIACTGVDHFTTTLAHPSVPPCIEDPEDVHSGVSHYESDSTFDGDASKDDSSLFDSIDSSGTKHITFHGQEMHSTPRRSSGKIKNGITKTRKKFRRPKTYTKPVPSRFCHICSRIPREFSPHLICGNMYKGICRKTVCKKCFVDNGWDWQKANDIGFNWRCTHCVGQGCPKRAQCHIYERTNKRRKNANTMSKKNERSAFGDREHHEKSDILEKLVQNLPMLARQYEHVNREHYGYVTIAPNFSSVNVS
eukprot:Plantae.Rhodophyta-Hildenbrandia_rubra.ctg27084.p1 GENE.Plantae.Rhodophyta-Hildenbrandia_rubra.ctg27084~~Plantae.Rhodophyta-Hildenbrandia_rubra.ctg27084.p1  ORF type:complete len:314 (+),score=26.82 Plantae.Rhodophyta-Hildenbrandia_rubra.ctg27084:411-1352(+)